MSNFYRIISESIRKVLLESEQDDLYFKSYRDNDVDTAMRMVLQAAKEAMPNSDAVDENGEPIVVYHGSKNAFNVFDISKSKDGTLGVGFYFTANKRYAEEYSYGNHPRPFYIDIKNTLSNDKLTISKHKFKEFLFALCKYSDKEGNYYLLSNYGDIDSPDGVNDAIRNAIDANYDYSESDSELVFGILNSVLMSNIDYFRIVRDVLGFNVTGFEAQNEYVVFSPSQIKSAEPFTFDDSGSLIPLSKRFDFSKNDIRY